MSRHVIFGTVKKYKHNPKCDLCKKRFTCENGNKLYCEECKDKMHRYKECKGCGEMCYSDYCKSCRKEKNIKIKRRKKIING